MPEALTPDQAAQARAALEHLRPALVAAQAAYDATPAEVRESRHGGGVELNTKITGAAELLVAIWELQGAVKNLEKALALRI